MDFSGKVVLVTGASRGIGRSIAEAFARQGARIALHYNASQALATRVLNGLPGVGHCAYQADLADAAQCQRLVEAVHAHMGRIDVLVNNAGIWEPLPFDSFDYETWQATWRRTLGVNLVGPANLSFLAARAMAACGGGRIVNVSSRGAFRGEPQAPAYGASKAGLNALGQSLAVALAPMGVFVATVAPGSLRPIWRPESSPVPKARPFAGKVRLGVSPSRRRSPVRSSSSLLPATSLPPAASSI